MRLPRPGGKGKSSTRAASRRSSPTQQTEWTSEGEKFRSRETPYHDARARTRRRPATDPARVVTALARSPVLRFRRERPLTGAYAHARLELDRTRHTDTRQHSAGHCHRCTCHRPSLPHSCALCHRAGPNAASHASGRAIPCTLPPPPKPRSDGQAQCPAMPHPPSAAVIVATSLISGGAQPRASQLPRQRPPRQRAFRPFPAQPASQARL